MRREIQTAPDGPIRIEDAFAAYATLYGAE